MTLGKYFAGFMSSSQKPVNPVIHIQYPYKIYVIGDLDGRILPVIKMFVQEGLVEISHSTLEFRWIAPPNVYIVQCGDQIDSARLDRSNLELDVSVILFFEYMRHLSDNRVHSIIGNHEIMNVIGDMRYVGESDFLRLDLKRRERIFGFDGICGRAIRMRSFAMTIDDIVFSHGCLWSSDIDEFCMAFHKDFQNVKTFVGFEHGDFYKRRLDPAKRTTVTWCRDDFGEPLETRKRITQDNTKRIYLRGHDKTLKLQMYSMKKSTFTDISTNSQVIDYIDYIDVMADAFDVNTNELPFGIIKCSGISKGREIKTIQARVVNPFIDPRYASTIHRVIEMFNNIVYKYS